jgi:hypothetical protein
LIESRSQWLNELLAGHPEFLSMRERALSISGGYSFANVTHTQKVSDISQMNRQIILQLIFQHLEAIGMYQTSESLAVEAGVIFQAGSQPWDRTDLRLLVSLAVGHREDPWNPPIDVDHLYIEEPFDEDLLAAPYREDPQTIDAELYDPDLNVVHDSSGQRSLSAIERCSLKRLVVNLVIYKTNRTLDDNEVEIFFLALNSITSAAHFLEHLVTLYDLAIDERRLATARCPKGAADIQLAIARILEQWMKKRISPRVVELIRQFATRALNEIGQSNPTLAAVLRNLKTPVPQMVEVPGFAPPIVPQPDALLTQTVGLFDPEPSEVARQISLICHEKFARIHPLEFITAMNVGSTTVRTSTLAEFFDFGDALTLLATDAFLAAPNKQIAYNRILEIAQNLSHLNNFDAVSCFLRFLGHKDVRKVVTLPIDLLEELWNAAGERERALYDAQLVKQIDAGDRPSIPNMHIEITGCVRQTSQPDHIRGLINWKKVFPHARRCAIFNHFQERTYKFTVLPQIQKIILKAADLVEQTLQERLEELARTFRKE